MICKYGPGAFYCLNVNQNDMNASKRKDGGKTLSVNLDCTFASVGAG
jgi:hypothetical protein